MTRALLITIAALLMGCTRLLAQGDASVTLDADRDKLLVGDQARVTLSAQHDPALSGIAWPFVPDSFGKLEVVAKEQVDTIKNGRFILYRQVLMVAGFDSGAFGIPPFRLAVTPKSGAPYTLQTSALQLHVQTVPVDTTQPFKPIKDIMVVESSWLDYIWWIVAGIAALIAIGLLAYFLRKKKPVVAPPPPPSVPLHVQALRALDALEAEGLWQKGEVKNYYVRLTDILRGYIEPRFGVKAMERTTDELTATARKHPELARHADRLYRVLATADMAKFARAQPMPDEHVATLQATREFITASIPAPVSPDPSAAADQRTPQS